MKKKQIFIYTENMPVDNDVLAHGMYRAGAPLYRAIVDHIACLAIFPTSVRFDDIAVDAQLASVSLQIPKLPTLIFKAMRRCTSLTFGMADFLPALLLASTVRRSLAAILLSFIGADAGALFRAVRLAKRAGKPYAVYLVDDFIAPLREIGVSESDIQRMDGKIQDALRGAAHVFTITDGLREHIRDTYGVPSTVLQLAFEPAPHPSEPLKLQIIFLGSVNFLYAEGLHRLFDAVERIRNSTGSILTVRLTVSPQTAAAVLGNLPLFVIAAPIPTEEALIKELASSLFAFLPYSFASQQQTMVRTSFPSKSLEYLAYARSIVVYGPEYGVATKFFRGMRLPSVASTPVELEALIYQHLLNPPNYSVIYRKHLAETHSLSAARAILEGILRA